ncbi:uncharacterized protein LOC135172584 [Diachasmimorpha longicaudata]|uniref:uncharacterized protein LOC135172584 n=1 Tax=Diachasmimorpha longicaudata TaxID=58733 RepID=UPI0030B8C229
MKIREPVEEPERVEENQSNILSIEGILMYRSFDELEKELTFDVYDGAEIEGKIIYDEAGNKVTEEKKNTLMDLALQPPSISHAWGSMRLSTCNILGSYWVSVEKKILVLC